MPLVEIRSLPIAPPFDATVAVERISKALSAETDIDIRHFMVTWDIFHPGHYASAGRTVAEQPAETHAVLVHVTGPNSSSDAMVERMLNAVAKQVAESAGVSLRNVFAIYRSVASGSVLDAGEIQRW